MDSFWEASIILSNFLGSLQHEAICLTRHQQISLLAAVRQGDVWVHHILQFLLSRKI